MSLRKQPKTLGATFLRATMLGVLVTQLAMPARSFAEDKAEPGTVTESNFAGVAVEGVEITPDGQDLLKQLEAAGDARTRISMSAVKRNTGFLLNQTLVKKQRGRRQEWDLTLTDLARPMVSTGAGKVDRALEIRPIENGFALSIEGHEYDHEIRFSPDGIANRDLQVLDYDWDNELVYLLLSDGSLHAIEVSSLQPLMYQASIPMFYLGQAKTTNGKPVNRIRLVARRVDPTDNSRAAQEARLDRNPANRKRLEEISNGDIVTRLKANLELVKPVDLAPELEDGLKRIAKDGKARLPGGDLGLIHFDGETETLVGLESRLASTAEIGLQLGPLSGLWFLASPEAANHTKELAILRGAAQRTIDEVVSDPAEFQAFYDRNLQRTLSRMPRAAMVSLDGYVVRTMSRVKKTAENKTPDALRDTFTPEQWREDYAYFQDLVKTAEATAERAQARSWYNPLRYTTGARVATFFREKAQGFSLAKKMRQACTVLKYPLLAGALAAGVAGTDYYVNHGQNVALAVDTVQSTWAHVQKNVVPIFNNMDDVWNVTSRTIPARMAILFSVFAAAWLARPFMQHGVNKILTMTGIKYLFAKSTIPPQRFLATVTNRVPLLNAAKQGYFPLSFLNPLNGIFGLSESAVLRASEKVDRKNTNRSLGVALALQTLATRNGVPVEELLQADGYKADRAELPSLVRRLTYDLGHGEGATLVRNFAPDPEAFVGTLQQMSARAKAIAEKRGFRAAVPKAYTYVRSQLVRDVLLKTANYGEARYQMLWNPDPSQQFSNVVARSYAIDGMLTIVTSCYAGVFADPANPAGMAYQPGMPLLNTHPWMLLNDFEQMFLHLGASAANDFLAIFNDPDALQIFQQYRPASAYDHPRRLGQRSAARDGAAMVWDVGRLRANNWVVAFGKRSWTQTITLLQGFFVVGMGLRLLEGVLSGQGIESVFSGASLLHATVGQLYFLYLAPFAYRWFWAIYYNTWNTLTKDVKAIGGNLGDRILQLDKAIETGDVDTMEREVEQLVADYAAGRRDVPADVRAAVARRPGEDLKSWATRVLEFARSEPPLPEEPNENVGRASVLVGGIVTTVLAMTVMMASFEKRPFWGAPMPDGSVPGIDWHDWNLWDGVSPHDAVPVLLLKSLATIYTMWLAGHAFNTVYDTGRWAWNRVRYGKGTKETTAAAESLNGAVKGFLTVPGIDLLAPKAPLVPPGAGAHEEACAKAVAESR